MIFHFYFRFPVHGRFLLSFSIVLSVIAAGQFVYIATYAVRRKMVDHELESMERARTAAKPSPVPTRLPTTNATAVLERRREEDVAEVAQEEDAEPPPPPVARSRGDPLHPNAQKRSARPKSMLPGGWKTRRSKKARKRVKELNERIAAQGAPTARPTAAVHTINLVSEEPPVDRATLAGNLTDAERHRTDYVGVAKLVQKSGTFWTARMQRRDGSFRFSGRFDDARAAAFEYDKIALQEFGAAATLNFPIPLKGEGDKAADTAPAPAMVTTPTPSTRSCAAAPTREPRTKTA